MSARPSDAVVVPHHNGDQILDDDMVYTHPYAPRTSRHVHFDENLQFADPPEWHANATAASIAPRPSAEDKSAQLGAAQANKLATVRDNVRMLPHINEDSLEGVALHYEQQRPSGPAQDRFARQAQVIANQAGRKGPATLTMPNGAQQQPLQHRPPPMSHQHPTPAPAAPAQHPSSPARRAINTLNKLTHLPHMSQPSLNTLLRPQGGISFNFVFDTSSTTVVLNDQTATGSPHFSPPRIAGTVPTMSVDGRTTSSRALVTTPLKPYQREQPTTSPHLSKMRVMLPATVAAHYYNRHAEAANAAFDSNYGASLDAYGGAGPMVVAISSTTPGASLTVGALLDSLRAILMLRVTTDEWAKANQNDRTIATEAFYSRIAQSRDPEREKAQGVRRLDWCGPDIWFGGLEPVGVQEADADSGDGGTVWRLIMRSGPMDTVVA